MVLKIPVSNLNGMRQTTSTISCSTTPRVRVISFFSAFWRRFAHLPYFSKAFASYINSSRYQSRGASLVWPLSKKIRRQAEVGGGVAGSIFDTSSCLIDTALAVKSNDITARVFGGIQRLILGRIYTVIIDQH